MAGTADILPDARASTVLTSKGGRMGRFGWEVPIHCVNCGKSGGFVPEDHVTHVFYLCDDPCFKKYGQVAGTMLVPDEVFWARVRDAQLEKYGRLLTPLEIVAQLGDPDSLLSQLVRDRPHLTPAGD